MHPDYRESLLRTLASIDQGLAEADSIMAEAHTQENRDTVEALRRLLVEAREKVEGKLRAE